MKIQELSSYIIQKGRQLDDLMRRRMPVYAGNIAVNHFKENFRKSGYVDGGLHPWKPAQRIGKFKGTDGNNPTLLSKRKHLFSSMIYIPGDYSVIVRNPVEYAAIHNEGGSIGITDRMRRYAWYRFYLTLGVTKGEKIPKSIPEEAALWRKLALTKKTSITIPKRQFIGYSKELIDKIQEKLDAEVEKILFAKS